MKPYLKYTLITLGVTWAVVGLFLLYRLSETGRYQFKDGSSTTIIDTRTGATYHADKYSGDLQPVSRGAGEPRP
ncbi:MAG: hypothetical protein ACRYFZ_06910 [Janthinobacterium lividum]